MWLHHPFCKSGCKHDAGGSWRQGWSHGKDIPKSDQVHLQEIWSEFPLYHCFELWISYEQKVRPEPSRLTIPSVSCLWISSTRWDSATYIGERYQYCSCDQFNWNVLKKIYVFLWFWLLILGVVTFISLTYNCFLFATPSLRFYSTRRLPENTPFKKFHIHCFTHPAEILLWRATQPANPGPVTFTFSLFKKSLIWALLCRNMMLKSRAAQQSSATQALDQVTPFHNDFATCRHLKDRLNKEWSWNRSLTDFVSETGDFFTYLLSIWNHASLGSSWRFDLIIMVAISILSYY